MLVRDAAALQVALEAPFAGYAVRRPFPIMVDLDRVVALVAALGTMVLSGILLGRARG